MDVGNPLPNVSMRDQYHLPDIVSTEAGGGPRLLRVAHFDDATTKTYRISGRLTGLGYSGKGTIYTA